MKKIIQSIVIVFISLSINAQVKVYSGGKVAVGSTGVTPTGLLDVCTSSSNVGCTRVAEATLTHYYNIGTETKPRWGIGRDYLASGQAAIGFGGGGTSTDLDIFIGRDGSGNLLFQTNSASSHNTRMTITSAGNIGIGTSSTSNAVEVASGNIFVTKTSAHNTLKIVRSANNFGASLNLSTSSTDDWIIGERATTDSDLHIYSYGTGSDVLLIKRSNGRVGIGTTSPSYLLDVQGGDINASGSVRSAGVALTSDRKFKTDITPISNALSIINKLSPSIYYWDTTSNKTFGMNFNVQKQYGLISQDVEQILPELISNTVKSATYDSTGKLLTQAVTFKSLNYIAFIPIMMKAIQEQQKKIDSLTNVLSKTGQRSSGTVSNSKQDSINRTLQDLINNCCSKNAPRTVNSLNTSVGALLYQNIPNPFNQTTSIKCYIPTSSKTSSLLVFDMNGTLKKTIPISGTGEINLTISGKELIAGMYFYTLIIDGNEIDTKKMILTEQ